MATRMQKLLTRAITPQLGNLKKTTYTGGGGKGPRAGTLNVHYHTPGMPQYLNDDEQAWAIRAFQTSVFVMRCIQTISSTIAGLPFMAGLDPFDPGTYDPTAPLAQLLGPSTPQAPGGPNPSTSSRMFWDWSIKQYIAQGRFAWETQLASAGRRAEKLVVALWPLVASYIDAIPTDGGQQMFAAFDYTTATNNIIHLKADEVFYAWKPAMDDWRLPESVLGSIRDAVNIQTGLDRYMSRLLKNDMVARTMVVTPPFDEAAARRAFRDQFRSRFTGVEHAGEIAFAEAERDEEDTTGQPLLQIEKIAQTAVESSLLQISAQAKIDITIAIGVPMSLIGNASQRTYANADSEYKNFWTITVIPMIAEIQEFVNQGLAPRVGQEVGWFDLSRVEALKPPQLFAPPMIGDVINFGVADAAQVANVLGIPAANATTDSDTDTVGIGVESSTGTSISGKRGAYRDIERVTKAQMISARLRWEQRPLNTYTVNDPFTIQRWIQRERLPEVRSAAPTSTNSSPQATAILKGIERIQERRAAKAKDAAKIRAAALAERTEALALELRSLARSVENDNAAYHEGVAHRLQSYPMLSEKEFAVEHPDADPDDYPLYMAGFKANAEDDDNEIVSGQRDWAVYDAERLRIGDRVHYQDKAGRTQHAVVAEHRRGPGSVHLVAVKHIHQAGKAHERISDQGAVVDLAELHKSDDEEFTHHSAKETPGYKTHVGVREDQAVLSDLGPELTTWDGSPDSLDSWLSDNDGALEVLANGAGS